jgi:ABC-type transporter Mla maintaining outer membrane lipid asymmetry ATPase subunit MlaF
VLTPPLLELDGVVKAYGGLRPLRVEALAVAPGETVVVQGPDEAAAAVLVDLVTGTALPDEGRVAVAGTETGDLATHEAWLAFLEQFGIVNSRVVLLDALSVAQNLAVPLTLDLDPLDAGTRARVLDLAATVGLDPARLDAPLAGAPPLERLRVRLARALAHGPRLVLVEHPSLGLPPGDIEACAAILKAAAAAQGRAVVVVTGDDRLAAKIATRRLSWDAASGRLTERRGWLGAFRRS